MDNYTIPIEEEMNGILAHYDAMNNNVLTNHLTNTIINNYI